VKDPFGKQKEEKRKEQKKKIDELYGKGTASSITVLEDVKQADILIQNDPANNLFNSLVNNQHLRRMNQKINIQYSQMLQKHVCCPDSTAFKISKMAAGPANFLSGF